MPATNSSCVDKSGKNVSLNRGGTFDQHAVGVGGPADNFKPAVSHWAQNGGASTCAIPSGVVVGKPTSSEGAPPPTPAAGGKDGLSS